MSRIELLTDRQDIGDDRVEDFDAMCALNGAVSNVFGVLMHSPGLAPSVAATGLQLRTGTEIQPLEGELMRLVVCRERDNAFGWSTHANGARKLGISDKVIDTIRSNGDISNFDPDQRDIVDFVRQLLRTNRVDQSLFDRLVEKHSKRWLVELTAAIGQSQLLGAICGVFEIPPMPPVDPLPVP